jgi:general secretion pathway protein I
LLEVMVAVTVLGLVLSVVLSAQGGLSASNRVAEKSGTATQLLRCKMVEVEEQLLKFGFQEIDKVDTDLPCCEDQDTADFRCDVRVEKVELPNPNSSSGDGGVGAALNLGGPGGIASGLAAAGAGAATAGGPQAALGAVANVTGMNLSLDGGLQDLGNQVLAQGAGAVGGAEGLLQMAMGLIYPSLKIVLEASIRRVTVTVKYKQGLRPQSQSLMQYVTQPQRGGLASDVVPGMMPSGVPGGGAAPPGGTTGAPGGRPR